VLEAGTHNQEETMSNTQQSATAPTHTDDELMSIKEVAALLRAPEATLRYWRHLGTGPHSFRVGRSVRYWRTDVIAWLDAQSKNPQANR
jgi:predicted DNA-binding transcriptional regulator AlpA